jgi:hypothetical protein
MSDEKAAADQVESVDETEVSPMEKNLTSRDTWMRFLFMVISAVLMSITGIVGTVVVWLGFLWVLFTGETNRQLQTVGQSIASYVYQIVCYLTFNSDEKPFPLGGEWPSGEKGI